MGQSSSKFSSEIVSDPQQPKKEGYYRFACLSDTHGMFHKMTDYQIYPADFVIIAGDITNYGQQEHVQATVDWLLNFPAPNKILVAGNHDLSLDRANYDSFHKHPENTDLERVNDIVHTEGITYLMNQSIVIDGITIYGSPYSLECGDWAFPIFDEKDPINWANLPLDADVIVTHGPPYDILDKTSAGFKAGSKSLLKKVKKIQPALHIFGHVHECYGSLKVKNTMFANVSLVNKNYQFTNPITYFDLKPKI